MRSHHPFDPATTKDRPQHDTTLGAPLPSALEPHMEPLQQALTTFPAGKLVGAGDTGVEFLSVYRRLLAEIETWCNPTSGPITQVIRWQALRDYVEVYSLTYPRQPSYPFPPRFGRYAAYLDGFDDIVEAIDTWCEWLSCQFLPGVVPIDLIRSALDEWDELRRASTTSQAPALSYQIVSLARSVGEAAYRP